MQQNRSIYLITIVKAGKMESLTNKLANADLEESLNTSDLEEDDDAVSSSSEEQEISVHSTHTSDSEHDTQSPEQESDQESSAGSGAIGSESESESDDEVANLQPTTHRRKRSRPDRWVSQVNHYQKTTDLLIQRVPFDRLVREVAQDYKTDVRFTSDAMEAIQSSAEDHLVKVMKAAQLLAIHADRETIMPKDFELVFQIQAIFQS